MITVVGSANMDLSARVQRLPEAGETVLAASFARSPGGKGANQAVAAARAGSLVQLVANLGDDADGDALRRSLADSEVRLGHLRIASDAPTGLAMIEVDSDGENSIVVVPGANARVTVDDIDAARETIEQSNVLVLQLEIPVDTVTYAAELARGAGTLIILNPSPARALDRRLLHLVDVVVANEQEVATLAGVGYPFESASAARILLNTGTDAVVVTLGARGAVIVTHHNEVDLQAYAVESIDTTGAGDAFVGNLAHGLDAGKTLEEAARFAMAAAALSVQKFGAQESMPTQSETERFMEGRST